MGWTFERSTKTPMALCLADFSKGWTAPNGDKTTMLAHAMVGKAFYAAMESVKAGERSVWALVCLTDTHNGEPGYKDMDETMGPNESKCPASILALLTPTESEWAKGWRARCYANAGVNPGQASLL